MTHRRKHPPVPSPRRYPRRMRLRELHERLLAIIPRLDLKTAPAGVVVSGNPGLKVTNWPELRDALDEVGELGHFGLEVDTVLSSTVGEAGGRGAFVESETRQANQYVSILRHTLKRFAQILEGVVPEVHAEAAFAVRLPRGDDLRSVQAAVDAFVLLEQAVLELTGGRIMFGGFDVGSHWVNILVEAAATEAVALSLGAALSYAKQALRQRKLVKEAQAAGIAAPDADVKLRLALEEYAHASADEIAKKIKPGVTPEVVSRLAFGMKEVGRLIEHGGEVHGLPAKGPDGTERPPLDEPLLLADPIPTKFLPAKAEGSSDEEPPPPSSKKTGSA